MAMNLNESTSGESDVLMDINTTPLIDVMLVLLVMLIITIPMQLHSVSLEMPTSTSQKRLIEPVIIKIDISANDVIFWNGKPVDGKAQLKENLLTAVKMTPQPELHIHPNENSRYEVTALVMASAQRVGLTKLGIVGASPRAL